MKKSDKQNSLKSFSLAALFIILVFFLVILFSDLNFNRQITGDAITGWSLKAAGQQCTSSSQCDVDLECVNGICTPIDKCARCDIYYKDCTDRANKANIDCRAKNPMCSTVCDAALFWRTTSCASDKDLCKKNNNCS